MKNEYIDWKSAVGMELDLLYYDKIYKVKITEYIKGKNKLLIDCNGFIKKDGITSGNFKRGIFGGVLNITQSSKNKFEYSQEFNCWFGWTTKGEKFAFDGDDDVINYILSNTWYAGKNIILNGKTKEPLHRIVWGKKTNDMILICFISNELKLKEKFYDNRKCNLIQKEIKNNKIIYGEKYIHSIKDMPNYYLIDIDDKYIKVDKNDKILDELSRWDLGVSMFNGKEYAMCYNKSNSKLLHRVLFGLTNTKYNKWQIDHINGDGLDNRMSNLVITDTYGNMCNVKGKGYNINKSGSYQVRCMSKYPDERLFKNIPRQIVYKTEDEAIQEVNRRREYVMKNRIYFHSKEELDIYLKVQNN